MENKIIKLNGTLYRDMIVSAAFALDNEKDEINNLNVFPVPDGDTGINMSLTMTPARGELITFDGNVSQIASEIAKTFLRSARGNSGVILSSFFRGLSKAVDGQEEMDAFAFIKGVKGGVEAAYKAVMTPTEGTILTVMRESYEAASLKLAEEPEIYFDIKVLLEYMIEVAKESLARTPEILPALKQANVVDAGGYGFVTVLGGMLASLNGEPVQPKDPASVTTTKKQADFSKFATEDITFPYCTECIVTKSKEYEGEEMCEDLHRFVIGMGDSVVFVEDSDIVKIHVHTDDPGKVLSEAVKYGEFYTIKVENMKNQHSELIDEVPTEEKTDEIINVAPEKKYGFVTVCSGNGIKELFTELGADKIVTGGQTMNPSTEDLLRAVCATPAEVVFVLPNNKNIFLAAKAAAELVDNKRVEVINTKSIPQGVAAMFAFDENASTEENCEAMEAKIADTKTASITYAAHDSLFNGKKISLGQILGLVENKVKYVTNTREECLVQVSDAVKKSSIITIYYGEDVSEEEAENALKIITKHVNPYADVTLVNGGQPVYAYIISGETE